MSHEDQIVEVRHAVMDLKAADLNSAEWNNAQRVQIDRYWSGAPAPANRHAEARMLWSTKALHVRFVCHQAEPLVVSEKPQTLNKTMALWDRDVCEIFIAPEAEEPERYFEFEAAPTGEWLDLAIRWKANGRLTDWEFNSGMTAAARFCIDSITISMRIPWKSLGRTPQAGTRWRANLFRCVGAGASRGYLAWQPTLTKEPSFHVPGVFGWIDFKR